MPGMGLWVEFWKSCYNITHDMEGTQTYLFVLFISPTLWC
jgi:hypothetical protein